LKEREQIPIVEAVKMFLFDLIEPIVTCSWLGIISDVYELHQLDLIRGEKKPNRLIWSSPRLRGKRSKVETGLSVVN